MMNYLPEVILAFSGRNMPGIVASGYLESISETNRWEDLYLAM